MNEKQLTAALFDRYRKLGLPRTKMFANANYGAFGQVGLTRGIFDLTIHTPGPGPLVRYLELKTPNGKLSKAQDEFRIHCVELGIPCAVAFGLDEAVGVLEDWKVIRPEARK